MKAQIAFFARVTGAAIASIAVGSLGCEQIIGLDGPYKAAGASSAGGGGASLCIEGASEECYSGDPALKGIGVCQAGTRTCTNEAWSSCQGEGTPSFETCAGNDDDCDGNAKCTGALGWALSFGGTGNDASAAIATDSSANVIVAGSFSGSATFGGGMLKSVGGNDAVVFKLDPSGKHIWSNAYGSTSGDNARGVAIDSSGNVIIVGNLGGAVDFGGGPLPQNKSTLFVAKLDPNGTHLWSKSFTGATGLGSMDVAVDASGNVVILMPLAGTINFGSGPLSTPEEALAVVKLDSSGNLVWSQLFGNFTCCGSLHAAIAVDSTGNVGIAGNFDGKIAFGNTMLTSNKRDVFLAKLSPTGESLWALHGSSTGDNAVAGLAFDKTGALIISGTFPSPALLFGSNQIPGYSNADAFVAKFDTNGSFVWGKALGMGGLDEAAAEVEVDAANNILLAGNTTSNALDLGVGNVGPAGMFVAKLDPTGKTIWAKSSDSATTPYPDATIAVDKNGNTLLTRGFLAPFSIDGVSLPSAGMSDIFVIKLSL